MRARAQVRAHPDWYPHVRAAGDRDRGADRDHLRVGPALERAPAREESRARGEGATVTLVTQAAQCRGGALDVRVHLVQQTTRNGVTKQMRRPTVGEWPCVT